MGFICQNKTERLPGSKTQEKAGTSRHCQETSDPHALLLLILNLGHVGMETVLPAGLPQDCHLHGVLNSQMGVMEFEFF